MRLLSGKEVAKVKLENLRDKIKGIELCLAIIQIGVDESSLMCIRMKENKCKELGVKTKVFGLGVSVEESDVVKLIVELNGDKGVNGIILQLPIPKRFDQFRIVEMIDWRKDADGLTSRNMGCLLLGRARIVPATTCAIGDLLDYYGIDVGGKYVVILGRSNLVGKPTALMLQMRNATVTVVHTGTVDIVKHLQEAEILVVACGVGLYVKRHMIKKGCIVVDVGINKVASGVVGDVDFEDVKDMVSAISPVPGGVGPLTVANMIGNTYLCYEAGKID